ncbi:MAG: capsule biosynthesis protein CapK [Vulcanimicrobiota bacterium]
MSMLHRLTEHESAPLFNYRCGDMLDEAGLAAVRDFETRLHAEPVGYRHGQPPDWVHELAGRATRTVPHYREFGSYAGEFQALPTLGRQVLAHRPESLVPDDVPLDPMIVYYTSGTTESSVLIPSHPTVSSMVLPLLRRALETRGVTLQGGPDRVALCLVGDRRQTLTYACLSSYLGGAGFLKVNLNPADWNQPADRVAYLDAMDPEVYTGDPVSFLRLAELGLKTRPKALVSSALALSAAVSEQLEAHFGCPVLDIYSLSEARFLTVATPRGHRLLAPDIYLEILDEQGSPLEPGRRGEVVVTTGRNPYQPLLRYRTGDFGCLEWVGSQPFLVGLEGREPVMFSRRDGGQVNNIDITAALQDLPLAQFHLHQAADGQLKLAYRGQVAESELRTRLSQALGDWPCLLEALDGPMEGKLVRYTRE